MKRFSFFLAVFSIGLMTFMILTGQFYKMFGDGEASETQPPAILPETDRANRLTYHDYDYEAGRKRFTVEGEMASSGGLVLSPESLQQQRQINNARISIPIYNSASSVISDEIMIDTQEVRYQPEKQQAQLSGQIEGVGISGSPRFSTEGVTLSWGGAEGMRMLGEEPVRLRYPAIELFGAGGFAAEVVSDRGLGAFEVRAPVLVALSADAQGSILGFEGGRPISEGSDQKSRVLIRSSGAMLVDTGASSARFEGLIQVHETADDTLLDHDLPLPARHLQSDWMEIALDPVSRRLTQLHARRQKVPVTFQLAGGYFIEGNDLLWKEGEAQARITGEVRITGPVGEFRAEIAEVFPREDRCVLDGDVQARLKGSASSGDGVDPDGDGRLSSDWTLSASRAEMVSGASGRLLSLRATGSLGAPVEIVEVRPQGARLVGGELFYDPATDLLEVTRGKGSARPRFVEGRNEVLADRLGLSLANGHLEFTGGVEANLIDLPGGSRRGIPLWLAGDKPDDGTTIRCQTMEMTWGDSQRLERLHAIAGEEPLRLDRAGARHLELEGDRLTWIGKDGLVTLDGLRHRQRLTIDDRAQLSAKQLQVKLHQGLARGDGEVVAETVGGPEGRPVKIAAEHLELVFNKEFTTENVEAEAVPGSHSIELARGWSDGEQRLSIEDGTFTATGQELIWRAATDTIRLAGGGEQRIEATGPQGTDSLSARTLIFERPEGKVLLEGDARATVHLGNVADATPRPDRGRQRWFLHAGRLVGEVFSDPDSPERLALRTLEATGGIRLWQPEGGVEFTGQACQWQEEHQRLRVYSAEGNGLQTLTRGEKQRDEVVSRELVLVRSTVAGEVPLERIEVLFIEVLSATLFARVGESKSPPGQFQLRSDNLLMVLSQMGPRLEMVPLEALAWGSADFKGGDYRVLADRAHFFGGEARVVLAGKEKQPLQVFTAGVADLPPSRSIEVLWSDQGYRLRNRPRGDGWSVKAVERALRLMQRPDRAPAGS